MRRIVAFARRTARRQRNGGATMSAIGYILDIYRDEHGAKSDFANVQHRSACAEISALHDENAKYLAALKEIDDMLTGKLPITAEIKDIIREATE
jgi:hypothetical protein